LAAAVATARLSTMQRAILQLLVGVEAGVGLLRFHSQAILSASRSWFGATDGLEITVEDC